MVNEKLNLFLENNKTLKDVKGSWAMNGYLIKSSALNCTMKNKKADAERINSALKAINDNTSVFSNFRGNNKLTTAITISFEDNIEKSLQEIISIYNKLKEVFFGNEYLALAAQVIFNASSRVTIDDAVKNTKAAYDHMKKEHRFLTGHEDIASAAMIATTSENLEETFKEIEECYKYLKSQRISSSNNIQALSHILSLINLPAKEKCDAVINMDSILREKKAALKGYNLPLLGILTFICDNKEVFADNIADMNMKLKKESGFGILGLGADFRNMISASLVSLDYMDTIDDNLKENIINNTNNISLTVAIAVQTAVMAATAAAASASASASS